MFYLVHCTVLPCTVLNSTYLTLGEQECDMLAIVGNRARTCARQLNNATNKQTIGLI